MPAVSNLAAFSLYSNKLITCGYEFCVCLCTANYNTWYSYNTWYRLCCQILYFRLAHCRQVSMYSPLLSVLSILSTEIKSLPISLMILWKIHPLNKVFQVFIHCTTSCYKVMDMKCVKRLVNSPTKLPVKYTNYMSHVNHTSFYIICHVITVFSYLYKLLL